MKTNRSKLIVLALAALAGVFTGCVSQSYDKGAATSAALQSSADQTADLSTRITDTLGALNDLVFKPQGDLRGQYDKFTATVKNLQTASSNLDAKVADVRAKSEMYFSNWSNQLSVIQSEQIRSISVQQKNDIAAKLKSVNEDYQSVKDSLKPFTSDLTDIQTYLGTDLTANGLNAIKDVVAKTKVDAVPLRDSIKKLRSHFSDLGTALSPVVSSGGK
jgi:uncharacterized protein YhaN